MVVIAFFRFWRSVSIVAIWLDETPAAVRVAVRLAVGLLLLVPLCVPLGCKAFNIVSTCFIGSTPFFRRPPFTHAV